MICSHKKYTDGHCAASYCPLYFNKCPRHSTGGRITEKCTLDRR